MEPGSSLPHLQAPVTCPYLSQINPVHARTSHFLKNHFNIILPSTPECSKWSLSLSFPHHNPAYTSPLPHTCYMPRLSHCSRIFLVFVITKVPIHMAASHGDKCVFYIRKLTSLKMRKYYTTLNKRCF